MLKWLAERGWTVMNGEVTGDEEGECTYIGARGETVIDYVCGDKEVKEKVKWMKIGENIESDHQPIIVAIEVEGIRRRKWRKRNGDKNGNKRGVWNEAGKNKFKEVIRGIGVEGEGESSAEGGLKEGIKRIKKGVEECGKEEEARDKRGWWDKECKEKKEKARNIMRKWKKGKARVEEYRKVKKEYEELCDRKKKEEDEKWARKAESARTETDVWALINKERRKKGG